MANKTFYSGKTPSNETSVTHDVSAAGTVSIDYDISSGETTPPIWLLYQQPSSGRMVRVARFATPGTIALDRAPRTIALEVGENPDAVPVYAEWQDS